jgi:hypothetical protein
MATKFLANINLSQNELQNARVQNLTTTQINAISVPVDGQIVYDSTLDVLKYYDGSAWSTLSTGSGTVTSVTATSPVASTGGSTPVISIADGTTSAKGAVQLEDSYTSTSTTKAATPASVKAAYDLANGKVSSVAAGSSRVTVGGTATAPTVDVAAAAVGTAGIVALSDSTSTTSSVLAATPTAVKSAYDLANGKANPGDTTYVGTTAVALNRTSANQALTGVSSVQLPGSTSGTVTVQPSAVTGSHTITLPAATGTVALTSDLSGYLTSAVTTLTGTANEIEVSASSGAVTIGLPDDVTITGNLTVNGTTTTVNSTTVTLDDKNLELGSTASPTDAAANGGGITLKGTTDKTISWLDSSDAWTSSEHIDLATGKKYYIDGAEVLSKTALASGVTGSSLTSVGTIATGTWQGTAVALGYGGTGATSASGARDALAESGFSLPRKFVSSITTVANTPYQLTHGLGTKDITVAVYDSSDNMVIADVQTFSTSVVKITASTAETFRVVVTG